MAWVDGLRERWAWGSRGEWQIVAVVRPPGGSGGFGIGDQGLKSPGNVRAPWRARRRSGFRRVRVVGSARYGVVRRTNGILHCVVEWGFGDRIPGVRCATPGYVL